MTTIPDDRWLLCYVQGAWAFFVSDSLTNAYGDDWNDAPYEYNAGWPYAREGHKVMRVAWDGFLDPPCAGMYNSPWSVDDINTGKIPWLSRGAHAGSPEIAVYAGTPLPEFIRQVRAAGGAVYREIES